VVVVVAERVHNVFSSTLEAPAERMIFSCVVVITHVSAARFFDFDFDLLFFDSKFLARSATFVLDVVGRVGAAAVFALSDV